MGIFRGTGGTGDSTTDTTVTTVTEKAAEAASSATSAADSATSASNSASSASTSETNAATSETNAATSATASATSATASETAKTAAQAAQTAAETAETNAETAEANAVTAKNQAESARNNAQTAQTAAETAETNAETAYSNTLAIFGDAQDVQDAVDSASTSATTATTKATEAATSATNAANSATSAGTSETNAASSASQAATSANTAGSHATDAETAKDAAETAQAAAEAAEANINGLYLGSLANDPTLDGNGLAVTTGDLYFNTTENEVRVYTDNDEWIAVIEAGGDATFNSLTSNNDVVVKGNLEVQGTTITVDSATAQTIDLGDNDKIRFGDGDDLQVYHDGTDSYIVNTTGTLKLSGNTDVTGNITVSGTVDGRDIATDGATLDTALQNVSEDTTPQLGGDLDTNGNDIQFGDNDKAVFGDLPDLQIYHTGSESFIDETGQGGFFIRSNFTELRSPTNESFIKCQANDFVKLYHDNTERLSTTSSGVDVTGTLVSDGLTVDGDVSFRRDGQSNQFISFASNISGTTITQASNNSANKGLVIDAAVNSTGGGYLKLRTEEADRFNIGSGGDISFYDDAGTSQDFYWDASTSRLGLGTTTPSYALDVTGSGAVAKFGSGGVSADGYINFNSRGFVGYNGSTAMTTIQSGADKSIDIRRSGAFGAGTRAILIGGISGDIAFYDDGGTSQDFYWDASTSRLGLGTTSPVTELHTVGQIVGGTSGFGSNMVGFTGLGSFNSSTAVENIDALYLRKNGTDASSVSIALASAGGDSYYVGSRIKHIRSGSNSNGHLTFETKSDSSTSTTTERMRITDTGNVGIGTTSPSSVLSVSDSDSSVWDSTWTSVDAYTPKPHELFIANETNNTTGSFSGLFFKAGQTSAGSEINAARIAAIREAAFDTALAFSTRQSTGLNEAVRIDSSGKVGIGTTSPAQLLHLQGADTGLILDDTDGTSTHQQTWLKSDNGNFRLQTRNSGNTFVSNDYLVQKGASGATSHQWRIDNSEAARIDSNGRLGIGTTSPDEKLHVEGSVLIDIYESSNQEKGIFLREGFTSSNKYNLSLLTYDHSNSNTSPDGLSINAFDGVSFCTGSNSRNERMRIDSNGRLGIGTTSPSNPLHVYHATTNNVAIFESGDTTSEISIKDSTASSFITSQAGKLKLRADVNGEGASSRIQFDVDGSEAMRIDSSGNLLVGTTSALPGFGNTTTGHSLQNGGFVLHSRSGGTVAYMNRNSSDGTIVDFRKDGSSVGSISVTSSATTYNTTSDARLKTSIEPIANATDRLMQMNPISHKWIDSPEADSVVGFIAQEMQGIVPEAVSGTPDGKEMMAMDYGRITPVLVAALQEALTRIESLETQISNLTGGP